MTEKRDKPRQRDEKPAARRKAPRGWQEPDKLPKPAGPPPAAELSGNDDGKQKP